MEKKERRKRGDFPVMRWVGLDRRSNDRSACEVSSVVFRAHYGEPLIRIRAHFTGSNSVCIGQPFSSRDTFRGTTDWPTNESSPNDNNFLRALSSSSSFSPETANSFPLPLCFCIFGEARGRRREGFSLSYHWTGFFGLVLTLVSKG